MTSPLDPDAITAKWLQVCGSCDVGIGECTHPEGDYRPVMLELVREVERLRGIVRCPECSGRVREIHRGMGQPTRYLPCGHTDRLGRLEYLPGRTLASTDTAYWPPEPTDPEVA